MLKAVLFDLDDTLIDWSLFRGRWEAVEADHLRRVFDYIGQEVYALDDLERFTQEYILRTRDAWSQARSNLRAPHMGRILVEAAVALGAPQDQLNMERCLEVYAWGAIEGTTVFPDVKEALTALLDRGLRLGLVTNAYQPMALRDVELAQHGLLEFFPSCRFSAADVGYLKPHPLIFEMALECLKMTPDEVIYVGDNPVADIAGAQNAGMRAVMRVKQPTPSLISGLVVPDGAVNSLLELPAVLDMLYSDDLS